MARVPVTTNQQQLGSGTSARYQAADFSAGGMAIARGVAQVGAGIGEAADAADKLNTIYDEARAKDGDNRFVTKLRAIEYGDGGFYTTQNGDTLNARKPTEDAIHQAYQEAMAGAKSDRERRMLGDVLDRRRAQALDGVGRYAQGQAVSYAKVQSQARVSNATDDFIRSNGIGQIADDSMATVRSEARAQADLLGMTDAQSVRAMEVDVVSKAHEGVVEKLQSEGDPVAAARYRAAHSNEITADAGARLDRALYQPLLERQASSDLDNYSGGPVGDAPPGAQPLATGSAESVVARIISVESGGNPNARNPNSSAAGLGQFTDKTWLGLYRQHMPNAGQLSDRDILALKTDPATARRITQVYANQNVDMLQAAGAPVTDGNIYLGHFLDRSAVAVIKAAPNTPVASLLPASFIRANPKVLGGGKTAGDVVAWADKKMGGKGVRPTLEPQAADRGAIYSWIDGHDDWSFDRKKAAREEADRRIGRNEAVRRADEEASTDRALETVYSLGDKFQSVSQIPGFGLLPPEKKMQFGAIADRNREAANSGQPLKTDTMKFATLSDAYKADPRAFLSIRPEQARGFLGNDDFKTYLGWRRDVIEDIKGGGSGKTQKWTTAQDIMGVASSMLEAAGITTAGKKGSDRQVAADRTVAFQRTMLNWAAAYRSENGKPPPPEDIRRQADRYLLTGPGGFGFEHPEGMSVSVPNEIADRIRAAARKAGRPEPDINAIGRIYVRGKGVEW